MSKAPKKKESKERVTSAYPASQRHVAEPSAVGNIGVIHEEKTKKSRFPVPVWPEWNEQDIGSEKWDAGHKAKIDAKTKSPSAASHFFEDPDGKLDLPQSLKQLVHSWKRPSEFMENGKPPTAVEIESLKEKTIDLLSANAHIAGSEVVRWLISGVTALTKIHQNCEADITNQSLKTKASKESKDPKAEKTKKEDHSEDATSWKPWHHIWPKDGSKGHLAPAYNPIGKYCVKLFWMGCWRKVTVDDLMPIDEKGRVLFPLSNREGEVWPLILTKALIKVASLDYGGGIENSEFGDWSIITCLTGWIPEPIPLKNGHRGEIWKLLLDVLPNWKLPVPCPPTVESKQHPGDAKTVSDVQVSQKMDNIKMEVKDSKDMKEGKVKKEEKSKGHEEKKMKEKGMDRAEKDGKGKEKGMAQGNFIGKGSASDPEFVLFASYSSIPKTPLKITALREMANASETLRLSGLSHNHPHPVLLTTVRNCPLVAPPTPVPVPRWKLIRQKKQRQPVESDPVPVEPPRDPEFVQVFSPFVNYCVSPVPVSRVPSPVKWDKFKPDTPMESVDEENDSLEAAYTEPLDVDGIEPATQNSELGDKIDMQQNGPMTNGIKTDSDAMEKQSNQSTTLLQPGKKSHLDTIDKQSIDSEATDSSREKRSSKGTSSDKSSNDTLAKGRRTSKAIEPKATDLKRLSSKDSAKESTKTAESPKIPIIEEGSELEVKEDVADNGDVNDKADDLEGADDQAKVDTELWIDYEDFTRCFSTLWIFHKPTSYPFYKAHTEIKGMEPKSEKGKKGGALNMAMSTVAPTPIGRGQANISPSMYGSHMPHTEPPPPYLLVDSLTSVEITVGFTSFCRWFDQSPEIVKTSKSREKEKEEEGSNNEKDTSQIPPPPGVIIAEPYSWKSLVAGQPSLRIRTTGIKTAVLTLPAGRHFLRLMVQAPLGYHIDICSQTPFIFGDEDSVMQHLTKESCRFVHHAVTSAQEIGKVMKQFHEVSTDYERNIDLGMPCDATTSYENHVNEYFQSLFTLAKTDFGENCPPALTFAIEALKLKTLLHLKPRKSDRMTQRNRSDSDLANRTEANRYNSRLQSFPESMFPKIDVQGARFAATKIQANFRGFYVRKLTKAFEMGTEENKTVNEVLSKLWGIICANLETNAVRLYRRMFELRPSLYPLYPFYNDEWTRVAYTDYHGTYNEQTSQTWFIVFREVFYVQEPVLVVPRMYINIPSCSLRVIDNDTKEDLPRVFLKVAPKELEKNKTGYTFVAEAKSSAGVIPPGKFRLRLIGACDPLPAPSKEGFVNTTFNTKEIRDYYIPNRHNIIMRYTVKVAGDVLTSIQFATSKSDVYIKLQVLDHDSEVVSVQGKGHVVIPALTFLKDRTSEDDDEKSSRKGSRQGSSRSSPKPSKATKRPSTSHMSTAAKQNKKVDKEGIDQQLSDEVFVNNMDSGELPLNEEEESPLPIIHKYIIQAIVIRDSWPLSKSHWNFVAMLKSMEKIDGEAESNRPDKEKHSAGAKGKKGSKKDADGRNSKGLNANSRPGSQNIDSTKPSWVLRVVTDVNAPEADIRKDTERQDQIKAMKAAWEAADPGRAAKALQVRMKFLKENTITVEKGKSFDEDDAELDGLSAPIPNEPALVSPTSPGPSEPDSSELTLIPPPTQQEYVLKPFDISPYVRTLGRTVLLDENEQERIHAEHERQQRCFIATREEVLKRREEDLNQRNAEKEFQIQMYEDIQAKVDEIREVHKQLRDKYCQKYLEQPVAPVVQETENEKKRKTPSPSRGRKTPKGKTSNHQEKEKRNKRTTRFAPCFFKFLPLVEEYLSFKSHTNPRPPR